MGSGAKRSRGRREPLADQVERAGHVVLTSLWTACVWLLRMILRYAWRVAAHAGRWLLRQRRWVQLAGERGWGEYRTAPTFMDDVADTYSFNDGALRRLHETLKDAVDPKGILSAGRYGVWPKHLRKPRA